MNGGCIIAYPHAHTVSHTFMWSVAGVLANNDGPPIVDMFHQRCWPGDDLAQGRNRLVERFLATGADLMFMADTDIGFPGYTVDALAHTMQDEGVRAVSALYHVAHEGRMGVLGAPEHLDVVPMAGMWDGDGFRHIDRAPRWRRRVDVVGAGCLLVHREALENIGRDWFTIMRAGDHTLGEDISFCRRLADAGEPIVLDAAVKTVHHKSMWI